ncbi:SCO family protein [Vibrio sp. RC27]
MSKKYFIAIIILFIFGLYLGQRYSINTPVSDIEPDPIVDLQSIVFHGKLGEQTFPFDTSDSRIRILYFGFTKCPDVCPTSLAVLAGALNQLSPEVLTQFRPIFITLDPERDLGKNVDEFAGYFNPNISGMATSLEQTAQLANFYNVFYKKITLENSNLNYTLDHTSYFYFVKPDGTLLQKVPHTMTPKPILDAIETVISSPSQPTSGK